jgi:hypothetical protein
MIRNQELDGMNQRSFSLEQVNISKNVAVETAKTGEKGTVVTTSTGYQVHIEPVPDMFIQSMMAKLPYPPPPKVYIDGKDRWEENPMDPGYVQKCREVDGQRAEAFTDAVLVMSCTLVGDMPENNRWIRRLKMLGIEFDVDDDLEREFAFLKYVVFCRSVDIAQLMSRMGASAEDVAVATERFQRDPVRDTDIRSESEEKSSDRDSL